MRIPLSTVSSAVRVLGLLAFACVHPSIAEASCTPGPCTFTSSYRLDAGSSLTFKLELGGDLNNWFAGGISQVANQVSSYGVYVGWSTTSGNISVYVDSALLAEPDVWARTDGASYIKISPKSLGYSTTIVARLMQRLAAHEVLHGVVGAEHTGCAATAGVMTYLTDGDVGANSFAANVSNDERCGVTAAYEPVSPIILDLSGNGLSLTAPSVAFDIRGRGEWPTIGWTRPGSDDSFLAMDRDSNGTIDSGRELFGNWTPLSQNAEGMTLAGDGFAALRFFDEPQNGGDFDGYLTPLDAVFTRLRLWRDLNGDGISAPNEMRSLLDHGIVALNLRPTARYEEDEFGNRIILQSDCLAARRGRIMWISAYDVFFATLD